MTSSISIFAVFIFAENRENLHPAKISRYTVYAQVTCHVCEILKQVRYTDWLLSSVADILCIWHVANGTQTSVGEH